jgi:hypothetical protein
MAQTFWNTAHGHPFRFLRIPNVVLTSWWRARGPLPARTQLVHYLVGPTGTRQYFSDDQPATDWFPPGRWQPGRIPEVESSPLQVTTRRSGWIDVDLGVIGGDWSDRDTACDLPVRVLRAIGVVRAVGGGRVLKVARIHASL